MSMVTVEDVLDDQQLRSSITDALASDLEKTWKEAEKSGREVRTKRDGYDIVVNSHGDIETEIVTFGGFANWVNDAGELALHVGPSNDPQTGASVVELLQVDADGLPSHDESDDDDDPDGEDGNDAEGVARWTPAGPPLRWPEWSPRFTPDEEAGPDLTIVTGRVAWAYHCESCGAASTDAADFDPTAMPERRSCQCGGEAQRTPAVMCDSCDTLILLHSTDPEARP